MDKNKLCINLFFICLLFWFNVIPPSVKSFSEEDEEDQQHNIPLNPEKNKIPFITEDKPVSGPDLERLYFGQWNYPYSFELQPEHTERIWDEIKSMPSEEAFENAVENSWRMIGPLGSGHINTSAVFSGRVLDIEVGNTVNPIIASASGGLWSYFFLLPVCISTEVTSLACGSFATNPADANRILLGTGEPGVRGGSGLWRTTNSGTTWTKIIMNPEPTGFYKIRHQNFSNSIVHAATSSGYYRSTNSGQAWTRTHSGNVSDVAVNPNNPDIVYIGEDGDGIYKSTNNGLNFSKVTTPGIPVSNVGRVSLSIGTSNSNRVYVSIAKDSDSELLGVYITANDGATWSNISPPENFMGDQGWYDNIVSVCPTNSTIALVGGVKLWRTTNAGLAWTEIDDDHVHADQHAMEWSEDGTTLYLGNDGGVTVSTNQGASFSTQINYLPITQYVNFDIGVSNRGVIFGGSQDNGFTGTTNGGTEWLFTKGGDGGGIAVDPHSALYIYGTGGVYSGDYKFKRFRSTDKGLTWDTTNIGVDPSDQWYTKMRSDRVFPINLFTNANNYVYKSTNDGNSWFKLNPIPFPATVSNLNVSKNTAPGAVVYACLNSTTSGQRLRVYDGGTFFERTSGIPSGVSIRGVATHITNTTTAYALINGFSDGEKVYKTTNKGVNWTNISGNLPDVPMGDLVPHPTNNNFLYLGTQMGCYRTTNAGLNWHRWSNGMPEPTIVTEMKWIDSTLDNGKFYVAVCTYGRSMWVRDISGDDPPNNLSLKMFIQGFYNAGSNNTIRDTVRIYLRNSTSPYSIADSSKAYLSTTGTASLSFPLAFNGEEYYLQTKHRNSIETWSSITKSFEDYSMSYDFSSLISNAYGENMILADVSPLAYAVYNGDVNQDGNINLSDIVLISNDASSFVGGYVQTDLNGDNITNLTDIILASNNSNNFVHRITP